MAEEWQIKCGDEQCGYEWSMVGPVPERVYCPACGNFDYTELVQSVDDVVAEKGGIF